tara:strand:+ start:28 stop:648 length:621 start_codon:yes stop_codon:yes gene_type:complete
MRHIEAIDNFNTTLQNIPLWVYIIPYIMHFLTVVYLFSKKEVIRGSKPLYDTIISNIPDLSKFRNIPNMLLLVLMSYLIIPLFFKPNVDVFISIYRYFSIILLLRSFTISSTILPPINSNCDFKLNMQTFMDGHCLDKIFSGHTAFSLLLVFVCNKFNILSKTFIYILLLIQFVLALSLILTREHYTVDVILGYLITIPILLLFDL